MKCMVKSSIILALTFVVGASQFLLTPNTVFSAQDLKQQNNIKTAAIKSITTIGDGDVTSLVIKLSAPATYTSYKTTAPLRLVLDLSQATEGQITSPVSINKGNFKTVSVNRFDTDAGTLTRIDIEISKDAEAVISVSPLTPGELHIAFPSLAVATAKPVSDVNSAVKQAVEVKTDSINAADVRKLSSVEVKDNAIILAVNGGVKEFSTFRLSKPDRYVIDLFDTQLDLPSRIIPLNASGIASARIGTYPDKIRVVLDSVSGSFPEAVASKTAQGLQLVFLADSSVSQQPIGTAKSTTTKPAPAKVEAAPAKAEAVPAKAEAAPAKAEAAPAKAEAAPAKAETAPAKAETAPAKAETAPAKAETAPAKVKATIAPQKAVSVKTQATASATVESIDFQVVENISRVAIKVSGDVTVEQPVKTAGYVTLTVKKAILAKQLQRSLETKSFASPVLRITPLSVKSGKGTDTKIRIAMKSAAPYEFRQEGDMLLIDFKNPEGLTADKLPEAISNAKSATSSKPAKSSVQVADKDSELTTELAPAGDSSNKSQLNPRTYRGRKVTLEFADAEVRKIFQLLSEVSNKNFVLGDEVTGTISIKLVNVPWDQALDIILDTKALDKREEGNIIIIKGKGKFKSQAEEEQELKKALLRGLELKTEIFSINYSEAASIVTQLTGLKSERGTILQDVRTNKIIVKDVPQAIDDMRRLINQLDLPEKQVMIEARIVEATSSFTRSLGVNWGVHYRDGSASFMGINQLDTSFGGQASTIAPVSGSNGLPGGSMGISFGTLTSNISLDLRLNAAASAGLIRIVSTPKVATLNNKTAKITQGQQVPFTSSTSDKIETKFVEAALALEVTPHINANGTIGMKIDAKNDSVGQVPAGSTGTAPAINKKQATTEMLLRDGETTVIGGIFVDSDNESDDGVPYLMDIPFLGKLFKSNNKTKVKTELLIFITPRILNSI